MMKKDRSLSQVLAARYRKLIQPRKCWLNTRQVLQQEDAELGDEALYVEGWCCSPEGDVFSHGWIEYRRSIVDPTLPDFDREYFAGLKLTQIAVGVRTRQPLVLMPLGWSNDREKRAYRRAYRAACASGKEKWGKRYDDDLAVGWEQAWNEVALAADDSIDAESARSKVMAAMEAASQAAADEGNDLEWDFLTADGDEADSEDGREFLVPARF